MQKPIGRRISPTKADAPNTTTTFNMLRAAAVAALALGVQVRARPAAAKLARRASSEAGRRLAHDRRRPAGPACLPACDART
jgi:hypothetical protein